MLCYDLHTEVQESRNSVTQKSYKKRIMGETEEKGLGPVPDVNRTER